MIKLQQVLDGHVDRAWCVAWNTNGTLLASSGGDKIIKIWSPEGEDKWVCKSVLQGAHSRTVRSVSFSHCGRYLVSASFDATVVVWERKDEEFEVLSTLEGHENEVKCAAFSPSGRYLASCSRDKSVWVWEMDEDDDFQCCSILNAHSQDVKQVLWGRNDDVLISVSYDNSINFYKYDGDDWVLDKRLEDAHESTVWSACFNGDDSLLATCSDDTTVKIWAKKAKSDWLCCSTLSGYHSRPVYFVDWCPLTDNIATACGDNNLCIFKQDDNGIQQKFEKNFKLADCVYEAHQQDLNSVRWNPVQARLLATCADDGFVKLWRYVE